MLKWRTIKVCESADKNIDENKKAFFKMSRNFSGFNWTNKIIQINSTDIYVIGGHKKYKSLLAREYDVPKCCLQINIKNGMLT